MNNETIIKTIEKELSLENISQETKEFIVETLARNIMTRSMVAILEILTDEEVTTFEGMLNEGKIEDAILFATEKHPDIEEIIQKTSNEVVEEYVAKAKLSS